MASYRWLGVVFLCSLASVSAPGQSSGESQTLASLQSALTTTVYGECFYSQSGTLYHTQTLSTPAWSTDNLQDQFRSYVRTLKNQTPAPGTASCKWFTSQDEVTRSMQIIELSLNLKSTQVTWNYTAPVAQSSFASSNSNPNIVPAPVNNAGSTGSISANAQQGVQSVKNQATSSVTTSVNHATNQTVQNVSNVITNMTDAASNRLNNLFVKKKPAAPVAPAGTVPSQQVNANAVVQNASLQTGLLSSPSSTSEAAVAVRPERAAGGGIEFLFCHLRAGTGEYYSEIFPASNADEAVAKMSFWREMSHTYKAAPIPFSNNVSCDRSQTEEGAASQRKSFIDSAGQRGVAAGLAVQTGWMYTGEGK